MRWRGADAAGNEPFTRFIIVAVGGIRQHRRIRDLRLYE
jgi:hypothetical protein